MSVEAVRRLVAVEKEWRGRIEEARRKAERIVEDAKAEAQRILEEAENPESVERFIEEERVRVDSRIGEVRRKFEEEAERIRKIGLARIELAVDFLVKRVLGVEV